MEGRERGHTKRDKGVRGEAEGIRREDGGGIGRE